MLWHTWWQLICDICDKWNKYKSHTCEEGGAHLRISFWHLLMNFEKPEKNQNFEKNLQKIAGDIIILHMCTKNHNYMRYSFWNTKWEIFLSFWANFYPLTPPLTTQKTKIMKKWKKTSGDVIILDLCNKKQDQVIMLTQIWSVTNIIFYHFRPFFALFAYWLQKLKFGKKCNKDLEKLSFYTCTP